MTAADDDSNPPRIRLTLKTDWSGLAELPVQVVNQFVASVALPGQDGTPDGVYLGIGHAAPPILMGSAEEMAADAEAFGGRLGIQACGRYFLTPAKLAELIEVLKSGLRTYDEAVKQRQHIGPDEEAEG